MYKQVAGAIVLSCVCTTAMAGYGFEPIVALAPDAATASAVAVGDVTGDGRDDVLVLAVGRHPFFRNRVILYTQTPVGFAPPVAIDYHPEPTEFYAAGSALGLADLDADADLDIVVSHGSNQDALLTVLRNDGVGFTAGTFPAQESLNTIKFMDVDGDGHLDLVGLDNYGGIAIFPGDGAAGFGEATWMPYVAYPSGSRFQLADMDGDGRKDLVYHLYENILVRRNEGTGFSSTPRTLFTFDAGGFAARFAVADFDGDNRTDLVVASDSWPTHTLLFCPQGTDGRFRRKRPVGTAPEYAYALHADDLDRDGHPDLLVLDSSYDSQLGVMFARAGGGFSPRANYAAGRTSSFTFGDLNDDGMMDVVLSGLDGGVSYMLGRASAMDADLAVFLGLNAGAAVVRVENRGTAYSVGGYELTLHLDPRIGSVVAGALPDDCYANTWSGSFLATCRMPALAPGAHHERAFTFGITPQTEQTRLFARARANNLWPELRLDNNVTTKQIRFANPADSGTRSGSLSPRRASR